MAIRLQISTQLDNRNYVPGEQIRGRISWEGADSEDLPEEAELRLFFYTRGKGTRDVVAVDSLPISDPGPSGESEFCFTLPGLGPYSFSGRLVSVIWALEFQFGAGGDTERFEFTLSPSGNEIDLYRHAGDDLPKYADFSFGARKKKISRRSALR